MFTTPETLAIGGLVLSCAVFFFHAVKVSKEYLTLDAFMLSDSTLNKSQFGNTFAASSISLATFIIFFFFSAGIYGLWLLVSPFAYLLGQYLFVLIIKSSNVDLKDCRTLSDFVYKYFPSKIVARLITSMTLVSYITLVFLELYIGSIVFSIFLPDSVLYQTISFFAMGVLTLIFVRLGGYKALIQTDAWQLTLMIAATTLIFVFSIIAPSTNNDSGFKLIANSLSYTGESWFIFWFVVWLTFLNIVTPFTQLPLWQRIAASKDKSVSLQGVLHSSWKVVALCVLPILGFVLLNAKGYTFSSFTDFLNTIKDTNVFAGYIIFPLLIVGLCSTVFSSADTSIIAITYALSDRNTFLSTFSKMSEARLRQALTLIVVFILINLTIIYWAQHAGLQNWLVPIIYAFCGLLSVLSPIPVYILYKLSQGEDFAPISVTKTRTFLLFTSILLAWAILLFNTYLSKTTGSQFWSQLSLPLGILIVGGAACSVYKMSNQSQGLLNSYRMFSNDPMDTSHPVDNSGLTS